MNDLDEKRLISPRAADLIIGLRDGDAALLYLYLCRRGMEDRDHIAHELYLPKQRLSEAIERLEMLGLLPLTEQTPVSAENTASPAPAGDTSSLPERPDLPDYTAEDVRTRKENDSAFSALIGGFSTSGSVLVAWS